MLDFTIPQNSSTSSSVITRKIECQEKALRDLIREYQTILCKNKNETESWKDAKLKAINSQACDECIEVIKKAEESIFSEYTFRMEEISEMENIFFHAMFIMTYSYFESLVSAMCKHLSLNLKSNVYDKTKAILSKTRKPFIKEVEEKYNYVTGDLRLIRNLLVHNYNGTPCNDQLIAAQKESDRGIGFSMLQSDTFVIEKRYIEHVLDCEYDVLKALASTLHL